MTMSKEDAISRLNAMTGGDNESEHAEADGILLQRLEELGDADVVKAYKDAKCRVTFWYS